jgi:hypothetical protein
MRRVLMLVVLAVSASAQDEANNFTADFRLAIGTTPSVEIEHGEKVEGGLGSAVALVLAAPHLTRAGGPLIGLEGDSAGVDQNAGNDVDVAVSSLNVVAGWAYEPTSPLRLEAAVFFGDGTVDYDDDHTDFDDVYAEIGGRVSALWQLNDVWQLGLDGRYTHGRAELDDIDGSGRDGTLEHDGFSVAFVVGIRFY